MQQSASQLFYRLLDGPADLRPLRILGSRRFTWAEWQVTVHVLGASHAVQFRRGDICLTELLTCADAAHAQQPLVGMSADVQGDSCASAHRMFCHVQLTPICLREGDDLTGSFPESSRLEIAFPGAVHGFTPVTRIGWRLTAASLAVETLHSYPEENRAVRTLSLFSREEAGK